MSKRLSRFKRVSVVPSLGLTQRDLDIIRFVHRYRFLRSSHVISLVGGSRQQILRRLKLLYHHGYLERPRSQLEYYHSGGSREIIYGLGNKSMGVLKREITTFKKIRIVEKNHALEKIFLKHELLVSDIMVALELACRKAGNVRLIYGEDLAIPEKIRTKRQPFRWKVKVNGVRLGVFPDRVFALECDGVRQIFFLEADRGTMPVVRKNFFQTSFRRKLLAYEATWNQDIHHSRFGFNRFRVLTVTTSAKRVKSLVDACSQLKSGHRLFLFADTTILSGDILSAAWRSGTGEMAGLSP